ncbi:MAG: RNA methyltransferase [Schaalia hyovaginalis]|uniref:TrmH family RNA methyltransferase n=1 Tax=Schaalia hyovaginalis TaxID=29316 RepID=UPI0026E9B19D|nr:RNA methyltransferase [Schaalia hyovaginalis]MCI7512172.1 RNA methyltransferase [Schaalia hyovaginalis]MDY5601373.1 RNA methyltransferase [Schaalia hyovaginalis]
MTAFAERPEVLANPRAERVRKVAALSGRSARSRAGRILVEGPQAVRELLAHRPAFVEDVYLSEKAAERHHDISFLARAATRWTHMMTDEVAHAMSPDSQGVVAVARSEAVSDEFGEAGSGATFVVLAQGRDPGNVGTIIRTADAMGASAVITVAGTVAVDSPKVIRSSAGSVFHLPIIAEPDFDAAVRSVHERGGQVLGTSGSAGAKDLSDLMLSAALEARGWLTGTHAWVFGNEAKGLGDEELSACDALVRIDMSGDAESLNVASAAAMCLFASQTVRRALG